MLTAFAIIRVVVPWNPYSPKILRAAVKILAFIESGFCFAFSSDDAIHFAS
jgi:hypothetical protein